jgi:hypothetical protein
LSPHHTSAATWLKPLQWMRLEPIFPSLQRQPGLHFDAERPNCLDLCDSFLFSTSSLLLYWPLLVHLSPTTAFRPQTPQKNRYVYLFTIFRLCSPFIILKKPDLIQTINVGGSQDHITSMIPHNGYRSPMSTMEMWRRLSRRQMLVV